MIKILTLSIFHYNIEWKFRYLKMYVFSIFNFPHIVESFLLAPSRIRVKIYFDVLAFVIVQVIFTIFVNVSECVCVCAESRIQNWKIEREQRALDKRENWCALRNYSPKILSRFSFPFILLSKTSRCCTFLKIKHPLVRFIIWNFAKINSLSGGKEVKAPPSLWAHHKNDGKIIWDERVGFIFHRIKGRFSGVYTHTNAF